MRLKVKYYNFGGRGGVKVGGFCRFGALGGWFRVTVITCFGIAWEFFSSFRFS